MTARKPAPWAPEPTKTKAAILRELNEAAEAELAIPKLQALVDSKAKTAEELKKWESQNDWPGRQARAMESAKSHVAKAREAEVEMARYVAQVFESPLWRACQALSKINDERLAAMAALGQYVAVDYEKSREAAVEGGQSDTAILARSHVASVASPRRISELMGTLDADFEITRNVPEAQRPILGLLRQIAFPNFKPERQTPDAGKR
jgi:hypothetical protein